MTTETIRTGILDQATAWLNSVTQHCVPLYESSGREAVRRDDREIVSELLTASPEAFSSEHDIHTMLHMLPGRF